MTIKILHLYADIMNLYGEYGNIKVLEHALKLNNINVLVEKKTVDDELLLNDYNMIYIGCGTEKNQEKVLEHLKKYKDDIKKYIENNGIILATGNSYEMFGKQICEKEALGIFDFYVERTKDRITSDVIYQSKCIENEIVGFVNKMSNITHNLNPFFKVCFGIGENENNDYEGVQYKNFYGTYVLGPLLARNPYFLKYIVEKLAKKKISWNWKDYENERQGYELVLEELKNRE